MEKKNLMNLNCRQFIMLLSSNEPVPGGGGAAAFGGALGMALANMVSSLTLGKQKYADVQDEVKELLKKGLTLQVRLMDLVQKDAEVFAPLSQAYALPAQTAAEKAHKTVVLSEASKAATEVPLQMAEEIYEAMILARRIADIGSRLAVSDAGCASLFLQAALGAARYNILINLPLILDEDFQKQVRERLQFLLAEGESLTKETLLIVEERLK